MVFFLLVAKDKPENSQLSRSSEGSAGGGGSDTSRTDSKDIQEEVISMQVIEILSFSILFILDVKQYHILEGGKYALYIIKTS